MTLFSNNSTKNDCPFLDKKPDDNFSLSTAFKSDERCQHRALFMTSRLKSHLQVTAIRSIHRFWRCVAHRLYTLNYILYVLPKEQSSQLLLKDPPGVLEANFAVGYALQKQKPLIQFEQSSNKIIEQASVVIKQCLESEAKLQYQAERDKMYLFHGMQLNSIRLHIEYEDDRIRHSLKKKVIQNKRENPFEDVNCIVNDSE